jgi:hypothetical protein
MLVCPKCQTRNHGTASFCEACGKSLERLREADDAIENMLLSEARKGAWALGFVAVIQLVAVLIYGADNWALWAIAGFFAALAVWALKAPLVASIVGMAGFILLHAAEAFVDPTSIYKGILMKIVVVAVLVGAIRSALKHREFRLERGTA